MTQTQLYTRKQHMDEYRGNEAGYQAHRRYYAQFVTPATISYVVSSIGADRLVASTDRHFNDIPLIEWDNMEQFLPYDGDKLREAGDFISLSVIVCIAKEAARMYVESKQQPESVDIFSEERKPEVSEFGRRYRITMPRIGSEKHSDTISVVLVVYDDGYCELDSWYNFGKKRDDFKSGSVEKWEADREIWEWLSEWELVELKPIGPEDSEYFVTDLFRMQEEERAMRKAHEIYRGSEGIR